MFGKTGTEVRQRSVNEAVPPRGWLAPARSFAPERTTNNLREKQAAAGRPWRTMPY